MEVVATAKNIRISPQKVRLVVDQIKKLSPANAVKILGHVSQRASLPLKKVIASAIANAQNNFGLNGNTLTIKEITVGKGPSFKRFRPIARGRAHSILKRTSNIRVVLVGEQKEEVPPKEVSKESKVPEVAKVSKVANSIESESERVKGAKKWDKKLTL